MITADDPRHGRRAGYCQGCRCDACRRAQARYDKQRALRRHRGERLSLPVIGSQRRIRALMAIGWRASDIAKAAGWRNSQNVDVLFRAGRTLVWASSYNRVKQAYDRLSMTTGPSKITAAYARRHGWPPPLAWDDATIDDPDAGPADPGDEPIIDEVLVQRALDGIKVKATMAERLIVLDRWMAAGRPLAELERTQSWNVHRYLRERQTEEAAA